MHVNALIFQLISMDFNGFYRILSNFMNFFIFEFSGGSAGGVPPPNIIIFRDQGGGVLGRSNRLHRSSHSFAPPQTQIFNKNSSNCLTFFTGISANFARSWSKSSFFEQILMKFCRNFTKFDYFLSRFLQNFRESWILNGFGGTGVPNNFREIADFQVWGVPGGVQPCQGA